MRNVIVGNAGASRRNVSGEIQTALVGMEEMTQLSCRLCSIKASEEISHCFLDCFMILT